MEFKDHQERVKVIQGFVGQELIDQILPFIFGLGQSVELDNHHIIEISNKLLGKNFMFDISNTTISNSICRYQSGNNLCNVPLHPKIIKLQELICEYLNICNENSFLQIIDMEKGGAIAPHYDASIPGFINLKCNVSLVSKPYSIYIDNKEFQIKERDLYCFEASLYKHWTNPFKDKRILLSYGFLVPYESLSRDINDPRVRMSERIQKIFQH